MNCRNYKDVEVLYTYMFVHLFVLMVLASNTANKSVRIKILMAPISR